MNHTPGPWEIADTYRRNCDHVSMISQGNGLAIDVFSAPASKCHLADARLIAAAPELLAALESLRNCMVARAAVEGDLPWTSDVVKAMQSANSAISKATVGQK